MFIFPFEMVCCFLCDEPVFGILNPLLIIFAYYKGRKKVGSKVMALQTW